MSYTLQALLSEGVLGREAARIERRLADTARQVGGTREELEAKHKVLTMQVRPADGLTI